MVEASTVSLLHNVVVAEVDVVANQRIHARTTTIIQKLFLAQTEKPSRKSYVTVASSLGITTANAHMPPEPESPQLT